ncbi:MAG TPA: 5-dehydro-4-deoxyglucarate dehydratase [Streptosporangiaceae bacterium]|jgi:5-dehydro-4-deoxyglucarate dehydratase
MTLTPPELRAALDGLLAFSLTPFAADGGLDRDALREHVEQLISHRCAAIFPACGTGEFFSLSLPEYRDVVATCVDQVAGRVPVVAGTGYGTVLAREFAAAAESAGADGLLVLPPYLIDAPQLGLVDHYTAVASSTRLGIIVYQRGTALFEPTALEQIAAAPNVIGFKDGLGQIDRIQRLRARVGDRLVYMNGMPTAEIYAGAMMACGVTTYSSALLTFWPEVSVAFQRAMLAGDAATAESLLKQAVLPFAEIRDRGAGYAVALVKAGARLRGLRVGRVRAPLADPGPDDEDALRALLSDLGCERPFAPKLAPQA